MFKQEKAIKLLTALKTKPESYWIRRGDEMALRLFHQMSTRVPAYQKFLKSNKVNPKKIRTIADFRQIPTLDKNNYIKKYPLESQCWDGKFDQKQWTIAVSSGSSGEPTYFPRQKLQDDMYALTAELYLLNQFEIDKKSTLYIVGFGMGAWIGGVFTYEAISSLAQRGKYPLSLFTPGSDKDEIIQAVRYLGSKFDQIIIGGYPPLIKDLIDLGIEKGLNWKKKNLRFIFSAESFTEKFRDYISQKTGLKNLYRDTLNHYGTADLGTMSHETPLSIFIRKMALKNNTLYQELFPKTQKLPTLTQFLPEFFYFEEQERQLFCSSYSGIPLVRYNLKDHGGIIRFKTIEKEFSHIDIQLYQRLKEVGIQGTVWHLPFVYVYERSDFSTKLYGANIFPEHIRDALLDNSLQKFLTGKFTMKTQQDKALNPYLEIILEMKFQAKLSPAIEAKAKKVIMQHMLKKNSEYHYLSQMMPGKVEPHLRFLPYEHPEYFKKTTKQKWVLN